MRSLALPLALLALGCGASPALLPPVPSASRLDPAIAAIATPPPSSPPSPSPTACARLAPAARIVPISPTGVGGAVVLVDFGGRELAYIADEDERAVRTVDLAAHAEIAITPLSAAPGQLLVTHDGRLLVALRTASAVAVLEPGAAPEAPLETRCAVAAPAEPTGLALTPDGARLLVTSRWGHALTAFATDTLRADFRVDLPRDPAAILTSADGTRAFVSHVTGTRLSVVDLVAHTARSLGLRQVERPNAFSSRASAMLVHWSSGQGYTLAKTASGRIFAPEILAHPRSDQGEVTTTGYGPSGSPTEIGDIAVIDEAGERLKGTPVLPFRDHADCLLPRAAAVDEKRSRLLVACLGVDSILAYDSDARNPHLAPRERWIVAAGPTGIAVDAAARRAVVWSQFSRTVNLVPLDKPMILAVPSFTLPAHASPFEDPVLALGRRLFHAAGDQRISGDGRACASCHPDGRDDGFTWSTPDGPRQTPMLAARLADTAPYGWEGAHADLKGHVRQTFSRLFGHGLFPGEMDALLTYVRHMDVPSTRSSPSTSLSPSPEVARGEAIFHSPEAACASCHVDAGTADGLAHDVQSRVDGDKRAGFDTPSLRFLGQSAPYFHDGRYETLDELLRAVDGTMGHTAQLDDSDRYALAAYLEAL